MADIEIVTAPEPVKVMVLRFDCPFCGSGFRSSKKQPVTDHMKICWSDKAKRTCRTCQFHLSRLSDDSDVCQLGEELPENAPVVHCPLWRDQDEDEGAEDGAL